MKLIEALNILKQPADERATTFRLHLACGFTPLDLKVFLGAHVRQRLGRSPVKIEVGLYGDLAGDLERLNPKDHSAVAVVIEWPDLDTRLGLRALGGWRASAEDDIAHSACSQLERLYSSISRIAPQLPIAVCLPTLAIPPVACAPRFQANLLGMRLQAAVDQFGLRLMSGNGKCRLVNRERLDAISPLGGRLDVRVELSTGFPYTGQHTSILAEMLASLVVSRVPRKGLITDLDDTLWSGIVGEVGMEGIGWTLERHAQMHGLYQQFLQSLADAGVLLAVASKNDPALVERALAHSDLLLAKDAFVPIEVGWGRKSEAVGRILKVWNIAPEAVVFIDDSEMEVAEVQAVYPAMDCRVFPKDDPSAVWDLIGELRDLFGRSSISEEDLLRSATIRSNVEQRDELNGQGKSVADFLRKADALITFVYKVGPQDDRPLELINKTHQFNLNGRRLQEAQWRELLSNPQTVVMVVGYKDRFGPLGRISVLLGRCAGNRMEVMYWVLSCRAFSRQIEHACLAQLFRKTGVEEIHFAFAVTDKNGPLREFLGYIAGENLKADFVLTRERFQNMCPELFHREEVVV
jgi:FkbH-like protein